VKSSSREEDIIWYRRVRANAVLLRTHGLLASDGAVAHTAARPDVIGKREGNYKQESGMTNKTNTNTDPSR
jgi:hypothetical protein